MRAPSFHDRSERDLKIEMTPMIDVVFLLLVFFVWTASFRMIESVLPSEVSVQSGSSPSEIIDPPPESRDFENIVVRIVYAGSEIAWTMNDAPVESLDQLGASLRRISQIKADAPVILHPDPKIPLGDVIDVYDLSRVCGFNKVQFAASGDPP